LSPTNITFISVALGRLYFAMLLEHLKAELSKPERERDITIRYGELVKRTKSTYSGEAHIEAAIPINVGTRLLAVQLICEKLGLPNLASLGVSATGEPGIAYKKARDWEIDKAAVLAFDWDGVTVDIANAFDAEATEAVRRVEKRRRRTVTEDEARKILYSAAKENCGSYKLDNYQKEEMVKLIMKGWSVDEAYAAVTKKRHSMAHLEHDQYGI
jgi:hypothetical protein